MNVNGMYYVLADTEVRDGKLVLYTVDAQLVNVIACARVERTPLVIEGAPHVIEALVIIGDHAAEVRLAPLKVVH